MVVVPGLLVPILPHTSQSPAVRLIDVTLAATLVVSATGEPSGTVAEMNSPTLPALALLFVVVPTIPAVCEGVIVPDANTVVKDPVLGVPAPIVPVRPPPATTLPAAKRLLPTPTPPVTTKAPEPLPLEEVPFERVVTPDAARVVKAPVEGVVLPTAVLFRPLVAESDVKAPVDRVVAPTGAPSTEPPVITGLFAN